MAIGEDVRYPTTEGGERNIQTRLTHRYLDRVIGAATRDARVNLAFLNVLQLVATPTTLFRPGVLAPALLRGGARPIDRLPMVTEPGDREAGYRLRHSVARRCGCPVRITRMRGALVR